MELDEEGFEPELLRSALKDVVDARIQINNLSEEAKLRYEKLDKMLLETKAAELYSLIEFLDALGFRLAISLEECALRNRSQRLIDDGVVSAIALQ